MANNLIELLKNMYINPMANNNSNTFYYELSFIFMSGSNHVLCLQPYDNCGEKTSVLLDKTSYIGIITIPGEARWVLTYRRSLRNIWNK